MANPSTTGPSGVGTEVLRRSYLNNPAEAEATILTGVANHIYTILSVVICDLSNQADFLFDLYVDVDAGGTDIHLLNDQSCGAKSTFIFADRIVLTATDKLHIIGASAASTAEYDVYCSYIDQHWS